jgi:hypothetical protein
MCKCVLPLCVNPIAVDKYININTYISPILNHIIIVFTLFEITLNPHRKTNIKSSKCLSPKQWLSRVRSLRLNRPCPKTDQLTLPSGYVKNESRPSLAAPICLPCNKEKILAFRIFRWLLNFQQILAVRPLPLTFSDLLLTFRYNISIPFDTVLILKIFQQGQKC